MHADVQAHTRPNKAKHVQILLNTTGSEPEPASVMVARVTPPRTVRWQAAWQQHLWLAASVYLSERHPGLLACIPPACPVYSEGHGLPWE